MVTSDTRLQKLMQHLENVRDRCEILGLRLIEREEIDIGMRVIALGREHDLSKMRGIEWEYLNDEAKNRHPELFQAALDQHQLMNPHHPEYWGTIHDMPRMYVAEMVCDWASRSSEFGTSFWDWVVAVATVKFGFAEGDNVFDEIKDFANLLLEKQFA